MVGERVLRNLPFVRTLMRTRSDVKRQRLLAQATNDEIFALLDLTYNILHFRYPLRPRHRRKLALHATVLRELSKKRNAASAKRVLLQKGNGPMFAALLAPILAEVGGHLISRLLK
jgi:hypothetical protein